MTAALPRKRRTREHIIADLSMNYVERFVLESGHTMEELTNDYGSDLLMTTFDEDGYIEPEPILTGWGVHKQLACPPRWRRQRPSEGTTMTPIRSAGGDRAAYLLAGVTLLLACPSSRGQQFVLFDATFTYTKKDADSSKPSKSHYYVRDRMLNADRPKDWTKPVDYRNGTVHIRIEVIEKPEGGAPTTWTLCYIPNKGRKGGYGCTGTPIYKDKGVYERDVKMTEFWQNDCIVWEEGIKEMHLVIKDDSGGAGHAHKRPDPEKFFPTRVRITMIQVAKGARYDPKLLPKPPEKK